MRANRVEEEVDFRGVFEIRMTLSLEEKLTSDKLPIVSSAFCPRISARDCFNCGTLRDIQKFLNPLWYCQQHCVGGENEFYFIYQNHYAIPPPPPPSANSPCQFCEIKFLACVRVCHVVVVTFLFQSASCLLHCIYKQIDITPKTTTTIIKKYRETTLFALSEFILWYCMIFSSSSDQ